MTDPERLRENFERNKKAARTRGAKAKQTRRFRWIFAAVVMATSTVFLLPGQISSFIQNSLQLRDQAVSIWLRPSRWEGLFSTRAEGHVDVATMNLSGELDISVSLFFEPRHMDFDGELLLPALCAEGRPHSNVLIRGYPSYVVRNRLRMEAYDFVDGERVELGTVTAKLEPPVMELSGWIFEEGVRLARDTNRSREDLQTLCLGSLLESLSD